MTTEEKIEQRPKTKRGPHAETYVDAKGEWRWRLRSANGRIISESGEGYQTQRGAAGGYEAMVRAVLTANRVEIFR